MKSFLGMFGFVILVLFFGMVYNVHAQDENLTHNTIDYKKVERLNKELKEPKSKIKSEEEFKKTFDELTKDLSVLNTEEVIELSRKQRIHNDGVSKNLDLEYRKNVEQFEKTFHKFVEKELGKGKTIYNSTKEETDKTLYKFVEEDTNKKLVTIIQGKQSSPNLWAKALGVKEACAYVGTCDVWGGWNFSARLVSKWASYYSPSRVDYVKNNSNETRCDYRILMPSRQNGYGEVDGYDWGDYLALKAALAKSSGNIASRTGDSYWILGFDGMCAMQHCSWESIKYNGVIFR